MTTVAYCPPGQEIQTGIVLALLGEHVDQIKPHPWLADDRNILLVTEPADLVIGPPVEHTWQARSLLDHLWIGQSAAPAVVLPTPLL